MFASRFRGAAVAAVCLCVGTLAHGAPYSVAPIRETTGTPSSAGVAAVNNAGVVQVARQVGDVMELVGIPPGGTPFLIADTRGALMSFTGPIPLQISDSGDVPFHATLDTGATGVFVANAGVLTPVAVTGAGSPFASLGTYAVTNASNAVLFTGTLADGSSGVFLRSGNSITTIADTRGGAYPAFSALGIGMNDRGDVAFTARLANGHDALIVLSGGTARTLVETGGDVVAIRNLPSLNEKGDVVFNVDRVGGARAIMLASGGGVTPVVASSSFLSALNLPTINEAGWISFISDVNGAGVGLFSTCRARA